MERRNFRGGFGPRAPPVREGEELDVKIEAIAEKGDGIAKKDGFVIFVPNVNVGDEVRIRVTKVLRRVAFSETVGEASASTGADEEPAEDSEDFGEEPAAEDEEEDAPADDEEETEEEAEEKTAEEEEEPAAEEPAEEETSEDEEEPAEEEEAEEELPEEEDAEEEPPVPPKK
ncbi:MAG: TRAM domain-containing protein [Nanoarchaeota archaeon]|nr:TRAM domain-containing protein [Nanoarchaeota archaeon]